MLTYFKGKYRKPILSPHELFPSFAPCFPLHAIVCTPASEPASNDDDFALQTFQLLQAANAVVGEFTGRNIQRMKRRYDASVTAQSYSVGEKVSLYSPHKLKPSVATLGFSFNALCLSRCALHPVEVIALRAPSV